MPDPYLPDPAREPGRHSGTITGDPAAIAVLAKLARDVEQLIAYCDVIDAAAETAADAGLGNGGGAITTDAVRRVLGVPR